MKRLLKPATLILLTLNGFPAVVGGLALMLRPRGEWMQLPLEWLDDTPFTDYFWPGFLLFLFNGLGSIAVAALGFTRHMGYPLLVFIQGMVLVSWILIQVLMLQRFYFMQAIYGGIGIGLIVLGYLLCIDESAWLDRLNPETGG